MSSSTSRSCSTSQHLVAATMESFVRRIKLLKPKDAENLVGCESAVLGSYWTSTTDKEEMESLYPVMLLRFDRARKLQGINMEQPMMGFRVTGEDAELSNPENPNKLLWMNLTYLSEYHALYLKTLPPEEEEEEEEAAVADNDDMSELTGASRPSPRSALTRFFVGAEG